MIKVSSFKRISASKQDWNICRIIISRSNYWECLPDVSNIRTYACVNVTGTAGHNVVYLDCTRNSDVGTRQSRLTSRLFYFAPNKTDALVISIGLSGPVNEEAASLSVVYSVLISICLLTPYTLEHLNKLRKTNFLNEWLPYFQL